MSASAAGGSAADIIARLALQPHPEGGHFRETFRDPQTVDGRALSTAALYLLQEGEVSAWHRIDAAEIWHFHAGAPLELFVHEDGAKRRIVIGNAAENGTAPYGIVPAHAWQSARSLGAWTLVGVTVAPGFEFSRFELAPAGWSPG
jgi:uncharacterized protein